MKLSTRTRYGLRAILELAENYGQGPLRLRTIAERQEISVKYLEHLMSVLKSAGIVRSIRGPNGGYFLARSPNEIRVSECFNYLEGPVITSECVGNSSFCHRAGDCVVRGLWIDVQNTVMELLRSTTLQSLIDRKGENKVLDYHI
jgi:Rrf2 family protein